MSKNKKSVLAVVLGGLLCVGIISQIVEQHLDKEGIKMFVSSHLKEEESETSFLEWIGF